MPTDEDQALAFAVRGPFTLTFECLRENPRAQCVPVSPMRLVFGAQVAWSDARRMVLTGPDGKRWSPARDDDEGPFVTGVAFKGPFPEKTTFSLEIPAGLKDDAGRVPVNASAFPLMVKTDAFPPLAKFAARFGILERYASPALPVTLRNVEPTVQTKILGMPSGPVRAARMDEGQGPSRLAGSSGGDPAVAAEAGRRRAGEVRVQRGPGQRADQDARLAEAGRR